MTKKTINSPDAPAPVGPYSHASVCGNLVFTSGQIPIDPATGEVNRGGIEAQTRLVLNNLRAVLDEAGSSLANVLKTTVFLKDMKQFADMNRVYAEFFGEETAPARSTVEVARLPKDVMVEIEAVAVLK